MKEILVLCLGNTCRSPMAWGYIKKRLEDFKSEIAIESAGIYAAEGNYATDNSIKVMAEIDIDISSHISRRLNQDIIDRADIIFLLAKELTIDIRNMYKLEQKEIIIIPCEDPYMGDVVEYIKARDIIIEALEQYTQRIIDKELKAKNVI